MGEVADLYVTLRANTAQFKAAMASAGAEGEVAGAKLRRGLETTGLVVAGSLLAGGVAAVKMAADFQASMQRVQTLAMGGKGNIQQLSNAVLGLAGQVGFSPKSLSEALYHIESNFYSVGLGGKQALTALKVAAEGAQIGGANLVDVTNALGAAVASGIPGVQNYQKAMQALLTTVGAGDMTMQNLADAFSNGILAIGKQFGITLNDMGAALATLGDNNIRGAEAGTYMKMTIMDLAVQSKKGAAVLAQYGIAAGQLGADLRSGGLNKALIDLRAHLAAAGITGTKVGQVLAEAFTKRSSGPLAVLMGQFDRLQSKYAVITKSAEGFGSAWQQRLHTAQQQWDDLRATLEAGLVKIGTVLMPYVTKAMEGLNKAFQWLSHHTDVLYALAGGAAALVGVGLVAWVVSLVNPFTLIVTAIFAVGAGLMYLYEKSATFRQIVNTLAAAVRQGLGAAFQWLSTVVFPMVRQAWTNVMNYLGPTLKQLVSWWKANSAEIMQVVSTVWGWIQTYIGVQMKIIGAIIRTGWEIAKGIFTTALHLIENVTAVVLDILTGHWSKLFRDIKQLVFQGLNDVWNLFGLILNGLLTTAGTILSQLWQVFSTAMTNLAKDALQWGKNIVSGVINGITSMFGAVGDAVKGLGGGIKSAFKGVLKIFSPSQVFHEFGLNIGQGLANGILASHHLVQAAVTSLGHLVKVTFSKHGKPHYSYAPDHALISALEKSFTLDFHNITRSREAIASYATHHKTDAGRANALAGLARLHTYMVAVERQIEQARSKILHDPHSTLGERRRINTEYSEILKQLQKANELHTKLLNEQIGHHRAIKAHQARRESARKAIAADQPTYLGAAAAAGWTTSARVMAIAAAQPIVVESHITATLDGNTVFKTVQRKSILAERRNTSSTLSARRSAKR